jgi:hypothetical protein
MHSLEKSECAATLLKQEEPAGQKRNRLRCFITIQSVRMAELLEYVTISISPNTHGQTLQINPKRPDIDTAVEAAKKEGLAGTLNKLGKYGYRLLQCTVLPLNLGAAEGTLFMYREVMDKRDVGA